MNGNPVQSIALFFSVVSEGLIDFSFNQEPSPTSHEKSSFLSKSKITPKIGSNP